MTAECNESCHGCNVRTTGKDCPDCGQPLIYIGQRGGDKHGAAYECLDCQRIWIRLRTYNRTIHDLRKSSKFTEPG